MCLASALADESPSPAEYRANWPRFRGPDGSGVYTGADVPVKCDVASGENVAWSAEVPAPGFGSPVIWGNRVFLSGGDEEKRAIFCFDLATGKLLWERDIQKTEGSPDEKPEVPDECGMAASTVATDGQRVYAMFANGDLAACDLDGKLVWSKFLGVPKNTYGHASSLLTLHDRLLLQFDQGEADDHLSKLYAFDGATGKVVWERPRPVGASWATPIVFDAAGKTQILTAANPLAISYAAKDGAEIWRAECLDGEVTPSPIFSGGTVFIVSPVNKLQAIRPDGQGDVTQTHLGWMAEDGIPDVTSPVSNGELVFVIDPGGTLTCYNAKDGHKEWQHELGDACQASPSLAGNHLYAVTKKGTLIVADATRTYHEFGRSELNEEVLASPAFAPGKMVVRGVKHLICIGARLQR
jgi:outer membrane protein assembly factor BamB